jgi:hypothetical protein
MKLGLYFFSRIHRRVAYHCNKKKKVVGLKHAAPVPSDRGNGWDIVQ